MAISYLATLKNIEDSLVDSLKTALATHNVRVAAELNPGRTSAPQADRECLVGWTGDSIGSLQTLDRGRVEIRRSFRIHIRLKSLNTHTKGYEIVDDALTAVHFLQFDDAEASYPSSANLVGYDAESGFYAFEIDVTFKTYSSRSNS